MSNTTANRVGSEEESGPRMGVRPHGKHDQLPGGLKVAIEQIDAKQWRVVEPLRWVSGNGDVVEVPSGSTTDFASTPRPLVWLKPRTGRHTAASVIHDYLWRVECPAGRMTYRTADRIFRDVMRDAEVPLLRRWVGWAAVRLAAIPFSKKVQWADWLTTLPGVLLLGLYALLFIVPPLVLIIPALVLWHLPEWAAFGGQWSWRRLGGSSTANEDKLVAPGIDFKT